MGIEASYRRLSPEEFERLCLDPLKAEDYFGHNPDWDDEALFAYQDALEESASFLDIDKDWQGLHFLLTGKAEMGTTEVPPPLGNVILGGTPTEWEATYGMVRFLTPEEVNDVALALEQRDEAELHALLNPADFRANDIYPGGETWDTDTLEYLLDRFVQVRDFFLEASRHGEMVLMSSD